MRPPAAPPCLSPGKRVKMVLNKEISAAEPLPLPLPSFILVDLRRPLEGFLAHNLNFCHFLLVLRIVVRLVLFSSFDIFVLVL